MSNSRYSLLVPCYNAQKYIDGFIKNIAKLLVPFDEVIFYDDGSTDNTYELLKAKGVNVIKGKTNMGPGFARNRLAELSTGEYIHFHDIDDEFNPHFLPLVSEKLSATSADVILGYADWIDSITRAPIIKYRYNKNGIIEGALPYFIANPLGIINTIYKKDIFMKVNGFNEDVKCWEDADLHVRLAAFGADFSVIGTVIAFSIRHNNGISKNQQWCWNCRLQFMRNYLKRYHEMVSKEIFRNELKKIQNAFINIGLYKGLIFIIRLNREYKLGMETQKISILYILSRIIPSSIIRQLIKISHKLNTLKVI